LTIVKKVDTHTLENKTQYANDGSPYFLIIMLSYILL